MKIISAKTEKIVDTPHKLEVRKLYDHESAQAMHITLQVGEALKPHITPVDVFFYILEGVVDVLVGNETVSVAQDHLVESPKDIIHCLSNNSNSVARILVVKAPKPATLAKFIQ